MNNVALLVLDVELEKDMRILPLYSHDSTFDGGHLIVVSRTSVMRRGHTAKREHDDHCQRQTRQSQRSSHGYLLNCDLQGEWWYLIAMGRTRQVSTQAQARIC